MRLGLPLERNEISDFDITGFSGFYIFLSLIHSQLYRTLLRSGSNHWHTSAAFCKALFSLNYTIIPQNGKNRNSLILVFENEFDILVRVSEQIGANSAAGHPEYR